MAVSDISYDSARPPTWGRGIAVHSSTSSSSSSRPPTPDPATYAGGPPNLDEFINGPLYNSGAYVEDVDVDAARNPKRRRLIHQASRRIIGRKAADQELIVSLFNELDSAMLQLQESNVASDNGQQSKTEIQRLQAISRGQCTDRALGAAARRLSSTDCDDYHDEVKAGEDGLQRQQGEVAQREGVITRLTDQVDKMRGDSVNQHIKLDELRGQRTALRKEVQELRAPLEDRDSRMLENRNDEVAAMEESDSHS